jgi:hypothetical protein
MSRPRIIRLLRIVFSAGCGVLCLLLIVLWVRSYRWLDTFHLSYDGDRAHWFGSIAGELRYGTPWAPHAYGLTWDSHDTSAPGWRLEERPTRSILGFRWGSSGRGKRSPVVPHWFPVSVIAVIGIAPWLPFHFSLRTLLIATTLVAVALGLVMVFR